MMVISDTRRAHLTSMF